MLKPGNSPANDINRNTSQIGSSGCGSGSGCGGRSSTGGRSSNGRRRRPVPDSPNKSEKMTGKRYRSEMDCVDNRDGNDCTQHNQRTDGNQAEVEASVTTPANKRRRKSLLGTVISLTGHSLGLFTPSRARVSTTPSRSPTCSVGYPKQTPDTMVTTISDSDSTGEVVFNSPGRDLRLLPTAVTARSSSHGPEHAPSKPFGVSIENEDDAREAVTRLVVVSRGSLHDLAGASPFISALLSGKVDPSELGFIPRSPRPASESNSERAVPIFAPVALRPALAMGEKWAVRSMLLSDRLGDGGDVRTAARCLDDSVDLLCPSRRRELAKKRLARERLFYKDSHLDVSGAQSDASHDIGAATFHTQTVTSR